MSASHRDPLVAGFAIGAMATVAGVAGHVSAGGTITVLPVLVAFAVASTVAALMARYGRFTYPWLAGAALVAQPFVHHLLGADTAARHHAHHTDGIGSMPAAHVVMALATAAAFRWGARWLRSLPALGRALLMRRAMTARVFAPHPRFRVPLDDQVPNLLFVGGQWGSRGPPAVR